MKKQLEVSQEHSDRVLSDEQKCMWERLKRVDPPGGFKVNEYKFNADGHSNCFSVTNPQYYDEMYVFVGDVRYTENFSYSTNQFSGGCTIMFDTPPNQGEVISIDFVQTKLR